MLRLPWWSSGRDSRLPLQGAWVQSLVRALRSRKQCPSNSRSKAEYKGKCKRHPGQRATLSGDKRLNVGLELACGWDTWCLEGAFNDWITCREVSLLGCSWKGEETSTKGASGFHGTSGQALEGIGTSCSFPQAHLRAQIYWDTIKSKLIWVSPDWSFFPKPARDTGSLELVTLLHPLSPTKKKKKATHKDWEKENYHQKSTQM